MWGYILFIIYIIFYGFAPHLYFRPYMAWLIACPYHFIGIFGLVFFFVVLYYQVSLFGSSEFENLKQTNTIYAFYRELLTVILRYKFLKLFLSEKFLFQQLNYLQLKSYNSWNTINYDLSLQWFISFSIFFMTLMYSMSYLPYGRFYNKVGGNSGLLLSYFYIFGFLLFNFIRNSWLLNNYKYNIVNV